MFEIAFRLLSLQTTIKGWVAWQQSDCDDNVKYESDIFTSFLCG